MTATVGSATPVADAGADQTVALGELVVISPSFTDADGGPHTAGIDWGDGSSVASPTVNQATGGTTGGATGSYDYPSTGVFTATVTFTDDTGLSGVDSLVVTVLSATPVVSAGADQAVDLGVLAVIYPSFTDADGGTHTAVIDWGDGSAIAAVTVDQATGGTSGGATGSYDYPSSGVFTATVTFTDDTGVSGSDNLVVTVGSAAPVVNAGVDQAVDEGTPVIVSATFADADGGAHTAVIDWGDGSTITNASLNQVTGSATGSYDYPSPGAFTATVTVTDDTGVSGSDSLVVTVGGAGSVGSTSVAVAAGSGHSCAITAAGGVQCWGSNSSGQLGDGTTINRTEPTDVVGLSSGVATVATGAAHSCAVTDAGGVKCWGYNGSRQLGNGTNTNSTTPVDVTGLTSGGAAVSAGAYHSCALTTAGGVKCWGSGEDGGLGSGTSASSATPVDVPGLTSGVAAVSTGWANTCALTILGGLKCWGSNGGGQLGDGTTAYRNAPVSVSGLSSGVASVDVGLAHVCAITTGGGVKCWGINTHGQLGDGTTTNRSAPVDVVGLTSGGAAVSGGDYISCAVTAAGGVKCWGKNDAGQLGNGTATSSSTPVDVTGLASGAEGVSAGGFHACASTTTGGLRCWGSNDDGQLGNGTVTSSSTPVSVVGFSGGAGGAPEAPVVNAGIDRTVDRGAFLAITATFTDLNGGTHTAAIDWGDGAVITATVDPSLSTAIGSHAYASEGVYTGTVTVTDSGGLSGTDSVQITVIPPSTIAASVATGVATGFLHTCALTTAGGVQCWGYNAYGQLGDGTTNNSSTPVDVVGLEIGIAAISVGNSHSCALTNSGGVKCWGRSYDGQLGNGSTLNSSSPVDSVGLATGITAISAGHNHNCALSFSGGIFCWGRNGYGELGNNTTTNSHTPTPVTGFSSGAVAVSAGSSHTCALTTSGGVKCWGSNWGGELGDSSGTGRIQPGDVVGLTSGVTSISNSFYHTCAMMTAGGVKCWGRNSSGQLGDGTTTKKNGPIDVTVLSDITAISAGAFYTCAITTAGALQCWGNNTDGQLGNGAQTNNSQATNVSGLTSGVASVAPGGVYGCALSDSGALRCWGGNHFGALGNGTTSGSNWPVDVIGFPAGSAPVVDAPADQALLNGAMASIDTTFAASSTGVHIAAIDWGDGTVTTGAVDQSLDTVTGSHAYATTITVTDGIGLSGSNSLEVTVNSETTAPVVDAGSDVSVNEGASFEFSFGFVDAASETHEATVVWGDGATATATVDQGADTAVATHAYGDEGVFVVEASVSDDVGLSGLDTLTVTVLNVAPEVSAIASLTVGDAFLFPVVLATFTDGGASDTHSAMVDWGDGTVEAATVDQGAGTISGTHPFYLLGSHVATVTVTDDDGAETTVVVPIMVFNGPAVPGVTGLGMLLLGSVLLGLVVYQRRRVGVLGRP